MTMILPPPKVENLTFNGSKDTYDFSVGPGVSGVGFDALLLWLPQGYELRFYDRFYPSPNNHGGFVAVQRSENKYIYQVAQHGWSTGWLNQSPELLSAWLAMIMNNWNPSSQSLPSFTVKRAQVSATT
ncbi:MAG: hypothetical protein VCA35_12605 [Roseibacillus sp.]